MVSIGIEKSRKWYQSHFFPLIPILTYHPEQPHNTSKLCVEWLFFKFWTLDSFEFELSFVVSSHWGIGIIGILPYLRFTACLPVTEKFGIWVQQNLWRRAKEDTSFS